MRRGKNWDYIRVWDFSTLFNSLLSAGHAYDCFLSLSTFLIGTVLCLSVEQQRLVKSVARISWHNTPWGVGPGVGVRRPLVLWKVWSHTESPWRFQAGKFSPLLVPSFSSAVWPAPHLPRQVGTVTRQHRQNQNYDWGLTLLNPLWFSISFSFTFPFFTCLPVTRIHSNFILFRPAPTLMLSLCVCIVGYLEVYFFDKRFIEI